MKVLFPHAAAVFLTLYTPAYGSHFDTTLSASRYASDSAILVYHENFFREFTPITALDMINHLPGFSLSDGDIQSRGLADAFGNLLINGQRPSDKTLDLETILRRIPVDQVARIELIREPLPHYEMRGFSQLANVILKTDTHSRQSFRARLLHANSQRIGGFIEASHTQPIGQGELTVSLRSLLNGIARNQVNVFRDPSGALIRNNTRYDQQRFRDIEPSLSYSGPLSEQTRILLNLGAQFGAQRRTVNGQNFNPNGGQVAATLLDNDERWWKANMSATLTHNFTPQVSSESQLLLTREDTDNGPEVETVVTFGQGDQQTQVLFQEANEESAFRQSINWEFNNQHSFETGGEITFNARDTSLNIFENTGSVFRPVDIPVANTRVEELRGEIFVDHVWSINETLSLESGLRYEYSEITQSGDANQERSFNYWKPRANVTWRPDETRRIRLTVQRNVDQLSFGNFASTVDLDDDQIDLGNPNYRPQSDWTLETELEHRFNQNASITLKFGRVWVSDLDDFIAITASDGTVFDAPGNIGDATLNRVTLDWTSPLGWLGLKNATLDGFVEWYDTDVTDPVTGEERSWSGFAEWEVRLDFRQTFPERKLAWGWEYVYFSDHALFRAREFRNTEFVAGDLDIYIETSQWYGLTTRLGAELVLDTSRTVDRIFYNGSRASRDIRRTQRQRTDQGPIIFFQVRGAF